MSPKPPQIPPIAPRRIDVLAFPDFQLLDVAGPAQVFAVANDQATKRQEPSPYRIRVIAPGGAQIRASSGLSFGTEELPDPTEQVDTLIVAGGQGGSRPPRMRGLSSGSKDGQAWHGGPRRSAPALSWLRRGACSTGAAPSHTGNIAICSAGAIPP